MQHIRNMRIFLLALLLCLIPVSSHASVFISVGFAPPPLPVYVQPPCPEPGMMWTPGYWAYGPDGYYWVPGAWVPAPYVGALWTPGYWGWSTGLYVWHPGYWGRHVGYYGGVDYGFGYMGVGFVGGAWRGREFAYNTAVMRVNTRIIRNTYVDRTVVERNTIVNNRHVAYSGGPGGINHAPNGEERAAMHERHMAPTSYQREHASAAMGDRNSYFRNNGGHPQNLAASRPLPPESRPAPGARPQQNSFDRGHNGSQARPEFQNRQTPQYERNNNQQFEQRNNQQFEQRNNQQFERRNNQQYQQRNDRQIQRNQERNQARPAPQQRQPRQPHQEARPQRNDRGPRGR